MSAYVIARYRITDPEGYAGYGPLAGPSVAKHGGEVVVADQSALAMEGEQPDNVVVLRFPSVDAARTWYESEDYQAAVPHRTKHTEGGSLVIAHGFEATP